jgi:hypothetical protein
MKIAIILNQTGIETVSVLSSDPRERLRGLLLCEEISKEISDFERAIRQRIQSNAGGLFAGERTNSN